MEQSQQRKSIGDFDGAPLEFLNFVYRSGNASLRTRFECAMFLVRLERELQQERDAKALGKFKGEAVDLIRKAIENEKLPDEMRLKWAQYINDYDHKTEQLNLPFGEASNIEFNLKPIDYDEAHEKGITEEYH